MDNKAVDPFVERIASDMGEDLVRFLARRVRAGVDARDLAQEAYVRLLRLDRKDLIREPLAYVYRVATNLLHEFELKRRADLEASRRLSLEHAVHGEPVATENEAEAQALGEHMMRVLQELTPKCRAVILLHRRDGMTYDEIAAELGISSSMVKKYLSIGLRHCRQRLADLR